MGTAPNDNYNDDRRFATGSSLYDSERFFANYRANGYDNWPPDNLPYHPYVEYGTSSVGHFGYYGYGLADMAGNVWDWTITAEGSYRFLRGGCWSYGDSFCIVSIRNLATPNGQESKYGFRVCR